VWEGQNAEVSLALSARSPQTPLAPVLKITSSSRAPTAAAGSHADKARAAKEGALQGPYGRRLKELMEHATQYPEEYSKVCGCCFVRCGGFVFGHGGGGAVVGEGWLCCRATLSALATCRPPHTHTL
jgi:hypothetical protein